MRGGIRATLSPAGRRGGSIAGNPVGKGESLLRLGEKAAGLRDLGYGISDQDLARSLIKAFSEAFQITFC